MQITYWDLLIKIVSNPLYIQKTRVTINCKGVGCLGKLFLSSADKSDVLYPPDMRESSTCRKTYLARLANIRVRNTENPPVKISKDENPPVI